MCVLTIDTSSPDAGSWAVCENGRCIEQHTFGGRASSALSASLVEHPSAWREVQAVLVGVGPGSFSGVRVAIALAQGLALADGQEVIPVRSSHAVALQYQHVSFLGIFCPARKGEWFVSYYREGLPDRPLQVIAETQLEEHLSKCSLAVNVGAPHPAFATHASPQAKYLAEWHEKHGREEHLMLEPLHLPSTG